MADLSDSLTELIVKTEVLAEMCNVRNCCEAFWKDLVKLPTFDVICLKCLKISCPEALNHEDEILHQDEHIEYLVPYEDCMKFKSKIIEEMSSLRYFMKEYEEDNKNEFSDLATIIWDLTKDYEW